jgi:hypothetical protein
VLIIQKSGQQLGAESQEVGVPAANPVREVAGKVGEDEPDAGTVSDGEEHVSALVSYSGAGRVAGDETASGHVACSVVASENHGSDDKKNA